MSTYQEKLHHLIREALNEDVGDGDHSTLSCIPADEKGKAVLKIKQDGILAGMAVAETIFKTVEPTAIFTPYKQDGEKMTFGEKAFDVKASVHTILTCERLVLNIMQRMSGIATLTHQYTGILKGYSTKILDTRKTTPNFRLLEKEAVRIGGGVNHRFALYDMIMLKDNHIDFAGGIENAISKAWNYVQTKKPELKIEVETRTLQDVKKVIEMGEGKVFRVMLDNFSPDDITEAVLLINKKFETEASGGINLQNIEEYAKTGVDFISVGALIHGEKFGLKPESRNITTLFYSVIQHVTTANLKEMSKKIKPDSNGFVFSTDPNFKFEEEPEEVQETLAANQQKLRVRLDTKKRAGKAVTLVENFIGTEEDLEDLGKKLKNFCGTGGSVKEREIIVQGDQRDKILQWLLKNGFKNTKKV